VLASSIGLRQRVQPKGPEPKGVFRWRPCVGRGRQEKWLLHNGRPESLTFTHFRERPGQDQEKKVAEKKPQDKWTRERQKRGEPDQLSRALSAIQRRNSPGGRRDVSRKKDFSCGNAGKGRGRMRKRRGREKVTAQGERKNIVGHPAIVDRSEEGGPTLGIRLREKKVPLGGEKPKERRGGNSKKNDGTNTCFRRRGKYGGESS